jgi:hypothetical protein
MKKRVKKLILNRETLRNLTRRESKAVLGAGSNDTSCRCRERTGCDCATDGCTLAC